MLSVNKEKAKEVLEAIEADARSFSSSRYSFDHFCSVHGLYSNKDKNLGAGDVFIQCPFHTDESPSLGINESKRIWNCFSCGRGGKYLDLVYLYRKEVDGRRISWYQCLNELLADDPQLQQLTGCATLFRQERDELDEFRELPYRKFQLREVSPASFPELASRLLKRKPSFETVQYALLLMQSGFSPQDIYKLIFDSEEGIPVQGTSSYNLTKILEDSDEL